MKTVILNALIVPMTSPGLYFKGDIGIEGKKIVFVGKIPHTFIADTTIDGSSFIAMPALVNAHTHLSMGLMRNYKDFAPNLQAWLNEIFPIESKLNDSDILAASRLGVIESIESGITTFNDMYFSNWATAQAVNEGKIRACLGLTLFGDLQDSKTRMKENPGKVKNQVEASQGRIQLTVAPHAIYTCSADTYKYAHDWAKDNQMLLHTHLAETKIEFDQSLANFGKTPVQYLHSLGVLSDIKSLLAHCVYLTDDDITILSEFDTSIAHNPSSNCKLASGIAPIGTYRKRGINVSLGTDGSSSNNNQNMFEEMHIASLLSTVSSGDFTNMSPYQVLEMATSHGAKALGLETKIGTLEVDKEADILLIDTNKSHLTPLNDPFSALVFSCQAADIDSVFCQGNLIMKNRKVLGFDFDETITQTKACWADILSR
ncbi:amidohydrolase [uncultured Sphaerochaeta sp.]|uniref:amidohydrolase n=1 Tax=uncultured Sphaerochaeta sp. TaxID=886478 RepID=UPI002A0A1211|nr:amidohydrolase [uncultured Sphaerochaeta sp.]